MEGRRSNCEARFFAFPDDPASGLPDQPGPPLRLDPRARARTRGSGQPPRRHSVRIPRAEPRGDRVLRGVLLAARAKQAQEYLATFGVPSGQLAAISYGKERPICADHDEACWQKNRRAHISQAEN